MPNSSSSRYLSYLLRLWAEPDGEHICWRYSLESPRTQERRGFPSLAALVAFLEAQTGERACEEWNAAQQSKHRRNP